MREGIACCSRLRPSLRPSLLLCARVLGRPREKTTAKKTKTAFVDLAESALHQSDLRLEAALGRAQAEVTLAPAGAGMVGWTSAAEARELTGTLRACLSALT